ncbi:MAG TPA: ATP-binding protein [Vicinamibacterales bacterium]|nr:ATP-binding protein [Vicinamibacterales bacterium]
MAGSLTSIRTDEERGARAHDPRPPFRDNPRLILAGIAVLVVVLIAILGVANRSPGLTPDYLAEFVLYALIAADLTMVVALVFVLARNIVKLVVERRRGRPFARFRAKLVALLIGMTLVPAVLVLAVGSELIRTSVGRWFNVPMDEILSSANDIAADYYQDRQFLVSDHATRVARLLTAADLSTDDTTALRESIATEVGAARVQVIQVYRVVPGVTPVVPTPVFDVAAPERPARYSREAADRLAAQVANGSDETQAVETFGTSGDLLHAAAPIRDPEGRLSGVVVATDYMEGSVAARSRRMTQAFENYNQLRVFSRPLTGVYLLFFLMVTLMILVGATWMGLYLAKRITRPVQMLAHAAREIGAGHLDQHVEPQSDDEFGALTEAFNAMASELATSRLRVEQTTLALEQRRRYVETILERITTGVISINAAGVVTTINSAAARLLGVPRTIVGQPAAIAFNRPDLEALAPLLAAVPGKAAPVEREVTISREGHEAHMTVAATPLLGDGSTREGQILVFDDVTPLIRAQKVAAWREVARRLAHEIKNPLTPIQLSAERLRRHFADAPSGARALVEECTGTIVGEVESLKGLVDEFSQFARMPAPRAAPTDVHALITSALSLYDGIFTDVEFVTQFGADLPLVRIDPEQIRRVIINVVDNAIEAMDRQGRIVIETGHDEPNHVVKVVIADNGPGIPADEREKLFLPYYSTKRRGSGLGLAIVRRIIAEHGGSIEASDNEPSGTRFTIELPS